MSHREDSDNCVPCVSMCLNGGGMRRIDAESETLIVRDVAGTIDANYGRLQGCSGQDLNSGHSTLVAFSSKDYGADVGDISPTLRAMPHSQSHANAGGQVAVAFQQSQSGLRESETHATLDSHNGSRRHSGVIQGLAVRRLTPTECERLQGFPDNFTLIEYRGKPAADGPRYRALGNSMAVPVMRWILMRTKAEMEKVTVE